MFKGYTLMVTIAAALSLLGVIGGVYYSYNSMSEQLKLQEKSVTELSIALASSRAVITEMELNVTKWSDNQDRFNKELNNLNKAMAASQQEVNKLNDTFRSHDLPYLALKKPKLIERRVNDGSVDAMRVLECATGSRDSSCFANKNSERLPGDS